MSMNDVILVMKSGVILENVDKSAILFYPDNNCIISLNGAASRICELLKKKRSFHQLVNEYYSLLSDEERPAKDIVVKDIGKIIEVLDSKGILEKANEG